MNTLNTLQTKFNNYPTLLKCIAYLRLLNQKNPKLFKLTIYLIYILVLFYFGKKFGELFYYLNH